jgi:hypothetical protein
MGGARSRVILSSSEMIPVDSFYGPSKLQTPFVKLAGRYVSEKPMYSVTKGRYSYVEEDTMYLISSPTGLHYWDDSYEEIWSRDREYLP